MKMVFLSNFLFLLYTTRIKFLRKIQPVLFWLAIATITLSCTNSNSKNFAGKPNIVNGKTQPDTVKDIKKISAQGKMLNRLIAHFKKGTLPVVADSVFICRAAKGDSLGGAQVKMLAAHCIKADSLKVSTEDVLDAFYTIDSVKANGTYTKWADKLDIGMIETANTYALQKIKIDDSNTILLWSLVYYSYDADPLFNANEVYYTLIHNHSVGDTYLLGKFMKAIDPPEAWQTLITGKIDQAGTVTYKQTALTFNLDDSTEQVVNSQCKYAFANGKIRFLAKHTDATINLKTK